MDDQTRIELEAAAFRTLREHLIEKRTDVQNIDMMNLAGFCRNCLSRWYQEAANEKGIEMGKDEARELFYGMTMDEWKSNYQTAASPKQQAAFVTELKKNGTEKSCLRGGCCPGSYTRLTVPSKSEASRSGLPVPINK